MVYQSRAIECQRQSKRSRKESETHMVRSDSINLFDLVGECCRLVHQELDEFVRGGLASEELELLIDSPTPSEDHARRNLSNARKW